MTISISLATDLPDTIAVLFPRDPEGRIAFGFAGRTADPLALDALADSSIRVRDYMMERIVAYSVRLIPSDCGTTILIDDIDDDRDSDVEWFTKKYIESKGIEIVATSL